MSEHDVTVVVQPGKFLAIRNPRGPGVRRLRGPATLQGVLRRVRMSPDDPPEIWVIFLTQNRYGLNPDDILNAHWDKTATLTTKDKNGTTQNLVH